MNSKSLFKQIFIIIAAIILLLFLSAGCDKKPGDENDKINESDINDISGDSGIDNPEVSENPIEAKTENPPDGNDDNLDSADSVDSAEPVGENAGNEKCEDGFVFIYNGVKVYIGDYIENILAETGTPTDYYESESCTSDGMMKTYCYGGGLEISSYAKTETDEYRIFMVNLMDDVNSTAEGLYIGQTVDDMIRIYGNEYEEIFGSYKYIKNGTGLSFDVDGDIITAISYSLINV